MIGIKWLMNCEDVVVWGVFVVLVEFFLWVCDMW